MLTLYAVSYYNICVLGIGLHYNRHKNKIMTKLTYIYLTESEITNLKKTCHKYRVSLSTLADVVIFTTFYVVKNYGKTTNQEITNEYLMKNPFIKKTSIKPKCLKDNELMGNLIKYKNIYASNVMNIYVNKRIEDYVTEEGKQHYYNMINEKLSTIKEQYWDYNNFIRCQNRNLKNNKEYYKRRIEQLEQKQ